MEFAPTPSSFSMADIIGFLFFQPLLNWVSPRIKKLSTSGHPLLGSIAHFFLLYAPPPPPAAAAAATKYHKPMVMMINREEVEMVMGKVGLPRDADHEELHVEGILSMFEEEEPSLDEVKEAFSVFDDNKDGFIDAEELQRVLASLLGFKEGSSLEACERMIAAFDENKDGRVDFMEFVKLMERSFC